jgi:hypothetical protein
MAFLEHTYDNTPEWGTCQEAGCNEPAIPCYLPDSQPNDEPDDLLCHKHAPQHGYCGWCGAFWGGIESFDMRASGLCDHCHDEIAHNDHVYDGNLLDPWDDQ